MNMRQESCIVKLANAPETASVCAAWLYDEWGHRRPDSTLEQSTERFLARANDTELPMAFVAIADCQPVGTASLVEREDPSDTFGPWLGSVYVLAMMRGTGLARQLITAVETEAKALGFEHIWLSAAVPEMYRKLGYQETVHRRHGELVMMKRLI